MKIKRAFKISAVLAVLLPIVFLTPAERASADTVLSTEELSAQSAVLICADSGRVVFEKNASERLSMASTTKIMTALITLEEAEKRNDPVVKITDEMVAVEGSSMGLKAGDEISLKNLAAGMLLASGNDAANAAAIYLGATLEGFAELMNSRARELDMTGTHFVTPSGLDDDEHYTTAYDMALLAAEAIKNESFLELCSSSSYSVSFENPEKTVTYYNHNRLLNEYEGCIGVKTGFTSKSGRCLVSAAERNEVTLIAVTLNAPDDWNDHKTLLDYGFDNTELFTACGGDYSFSLPAVGADKASIAVTGSGEGCAALVKGKVQKITTRLLLPRFCYAPITTGEQLGELVFYLDGEKLFSLPVVSDESLTAAEKEPGFFERILGYLREQSG